MAKESFLEKPVFRIVFTAVSAILATLVLAFSALTILNIYENNSANASQYLVWIFVCVALLSVVSLIKKRTKVDFIRYGFLFAFNIALAIVSIFAKENMFLFCLAGGLYCITIAVSRVFSIIQNHSIRNIIFNALIILFVAALSVGIFTTPTEEITQVQGLVAIECIFIAFVSFFEAARIIFAQLKVRVLFKIIVSTFSLEILFGLLTMIVCFSLILPSVEGHVEGSAIKTFPDALWYCFAVVTTIGFGDMVAQSVIGRILTVILGIYGLITVAVITSIIVNFYNETSGKRDQKEIKEISKENRKNDSEK